MSRLITIIAALMLSVSAFAQDMSLQGFKTRFTIVRNAEGKVTAIKLKKAVTRFTIMPFIEQIKSDLKREQHTFVGLSDFEKAQEVDNMLYDMGMDPYAKSGAEEANALKDSILNIRNIDVDAAFTELDQRSFWKEFESKLQEAFLFIDPTVVANLEDPRFFYKRQATYKVVNWALDQAKKRFSNVPVLNIASFVIVRVHDMMMEQRHFHHNMLLHYFDRIPETQLGMTKEELDRTVSSIYEYRIDVTDIFSSNAAARDWANWGVNKFFAQVRAGNARVGTLGFDAKKINFAFAEAEVEGSKKIYHLHLNAHQFSKKPALAYDYANPSRIKRNRALLNLGGMALGFIQIPGWIKGNIENFMKSFYVEQVRMEGALIGHFESTGDVKMIDRIYDQRANFYIVR